MSGAVACPVCGADGTGAANESIVRNIPAQPAVAAAPVAVARLRAVTPAPSAHQIAPPAVAPIPAPRAATRLPGQIDRTQAEHEARAKILWGDAPEQVTSFLRMLGFAFQEASSLVQTMFQERAATIRSNGIRKMVIGVALMCVPVVAFFVFTSIGILPIKLFALTLMVGCWGGWMLLKGTFMFLAPKSEAGDVAEH